MLCGQLGVLSGFDRGNFWRSPQLFDHTFFTFFTLGRLSFYLISGSNFSKITTKLLLFSINLSLFKNQPFPLTKDQGGTFYLFRAHPLICLNTFFIFNNPFIKINPHPLYFQNQTTTYTSTPPTKKLTIKKRYTPTLTHPHPHPTLTLL